MRRISLLLAALLLATLAVRRPAHADEFKLKDGSTIVGSVVGYVGRSFKVKTSYGYALVEKDKVVSIRISTAPGDANKSRVEAEKKRAGEKAASARAKKIHAREHADADTNAKPAVETKVPAPTPRKPSSADAPSAVATENASEPAAKPAADAPTVPSETPVGVPVPAVATPGPAPVRERVTGNTYFNETYHFQMYKPPDWQVMDGARSVLPGAIAALGTDDQSTYLVVGQEQSRSAASDAAEMEKRLTEILADYRPLPDVPLTVSGEPVVAHRFRGSMDEYDWSGFMIFLPHDAKVYTIFAMTRADSDLVQIQENVIRRTIESFEFLPN